MSQATDKLELDVYEKLLRLAKGMITLLEEILREKYKAKK